MRPTNRGASGAHERGSWLLPRVWPTVARRHGRRKRCDALTVKRAGRGQGCPTAQSYPYPAGAGKAPHFANIGQMAMPHELRPAHRLAVRRMPRGLGRRRAANPVARRSLRCVAGVPAMIIHWFKPYTHRYHESVKWWRQRAWRVFSCGWRLCFGVVLGGRVYGLAYRVSRIGWRGELWRVPDDRR